MDLVKETVLHTLKVSTGFFLPYTSVIRYEYRKDELKSILFIFLTNFVRNIKDLRACWVKKKSFSYCLALRPACIKSRALSVNCNPRVNQSMAENSFRTHQIDLRHALKES